MKRIATVERDSITTGAAANIAGVSPRLIVQWAEKGMLIAWRLPGSKHRRVSKKSLMELLDKCGATRKSE